jgi:hypothetical protein
MDSREAAFGGRAVHPHCREHHVGSAAVARRAVAMGADVNSDYVASGR